MCVIVLKKTLVHILSLIWITPIKCLWSATSAWVRIPLQRIKSIPPTSVGIYICTSYYIITYNIQSHHVLLYVPSCLWVRRVRDPKHFTIILNDRYNIFYWFMVRINNSTRKRSWGRYTSIILFTQTTRLIKHRNIIISDWGYVITLLYYILSSCAFWLVMTSHRDFKQKKIWFILINPQSHVDIYTSYILHFIN